MLHQFSSLFFSPDVPIWFFIHLSHAIFSDLLLLQCDFHSRIRMDLALFCERMEGVERGQRFHTGCGIRIGVNRKKFVIIEKLIFIDLQY